MTKACVNTSGTSTTKGAPVLFFRFHWSFHDLGTIRESPSVARNAGLVCFDHGGIGDDHLEHFVGPGGTDHRPVLVSLEVGERGPRHRGHRAPHIFANPTSVSVNMSRAGLTSSQPLSSAYIRPASYCPALP